MILDKLENKDLYVSISSNLEKGFKFLAENNLQELEDGKYEIDSDNVFALVQSYTTKTDEEARWETHRKYIDIQYIVKGEETISWAPVNQLITNEEYSDEKDIIFYEKALHHSELNLKDGYYGVFFPEDGHKPGCIFEKPMVVKKVVIKIKVQNQ